MDFKKALCVVIIVFSCVHVSYGNDSCEEFLKSASILDTLTPLEIKEKISELPFYERIYVLKSERANVTSNMQQNSKWVDRVLSQSLRAEYKTLEERLDFVTYQIKKLRDVEAIVREFQPSNKASEIKLTNLIIDSRVDLNRVKDINKRRLEAQTAQEQNFLTSLSYLVISTDMSFLKVPFYNWLTLNILYGRDHLMMFENLSSAMDRLDFDTHGELLKDMLNNSLGNLDPVQLMLYVRQGVESGSMTAQDLKKWDKYSSQKDQPFDFDYSDNDDSVNAAYYNQSDANEDSSPSTNSNDPDGITDFGGSSDSSY